MKPSFPRPENRSSFKETKPLESNIDMATLLESASERGALDIYDFTPEQKKSLRDWYSQNYQEIPTAQSEEILEQLLAYDLVSDQEVLSYIQNLPEEEKQKLAIYLGFNIKPKKYLQSFYELWDFLPYDEAQKLRQHFAKEDQANALMVEPFSYSGVSGFHENRNRLSPRYFPKSKNEVEKNEEKPKKPYDSFDTATELIENILQFYHRKLEQSQKDPHLLIHLKYKSRIEYLLKFVNFDYLSPYIDELKELGLYSKDMARETDVIYKNKYYIIAHGFRTEAEKNRLEEIYKLLAEANPKKKEDEFRYLPASEMVPLKYGYETAQMEDVARERATRAYLAGFRQLHDETPESKKQILIKSLENDMPILLAIEELGLTKKEIGQILSNDFREIFYFNDGRDLEAILEFNRRHASEPGPDLEKLLAKKILSCISNYDVWSFVSGSSILYLEKILDYFNPKLRGQIIESITIREPQFWISRLDLAIKLNVMPLGQLLEKAFIYDQAMILFNYHKIIFYLQQLPESDRPAISELVKLKTREAFRVNPQFFIDDKYGQITKEVFTPQERDDFLEQTIGEGNINRSFLRDLSESENKENKKYIGKIRQLYERDKSILARLLESSHDWENLRAYLSDKEALGLFLENIENIDLDNFLSYNDNFIRDLAKYPHYQDKLCVYLERSGCAYVLSLLIDEVDTVIKMADKETPKKDKGGKPNNAVKLDNLQDKLLDNYTAELEKDNFLIYRSKGMEIDGVDREKYVRATIDRYCQIHPEFLLETRYKSGKHSHFLLEELIGEEKFQELLNRQLNFVSVYLVEHGYLFEYLPESFRQTLSEKNPLIDILLADNLTEDYYSAHLKKVSQTPFYPLFAGTLERIAREENEFYGPRTNDLKNYSPRNDFIKAIKSLLCLNNMDLALDNKEFILALDQDRQNQLLEQLEFIHLRNLSEPLDFGHLGFEKTKKSLLALMGAWAKKIMDIDIPENGGERLDAEGLAALITYFQRKENRVEMKQCLRENIPRILSDGYLDWRYWGIKQTTANEDKSRLLQQLKTDELLPESISLKQYEAWQNESRIELDEILEYSLYDITEGVKSVLEQSIIDGHISSEELEISLAELEARYREVISPLQTLSARQQELQALFKETDNKDRDTPQAIEYQQIKKQIADYRRENAENIAKIQALRYLQALKKLKASDLASLIIAVDEREKVAIKKVFSVLQEGLGNQFPDFQNDLRRIQQLIMEGYQQIYGGEKVSKSKLEITDAVDIKNYLLIGEKPVPSCQSFDSSQNNSDGLLSYLIDPNVKIIQVLNEEGEIIARSILRLLADADGNPQLFLERVYSVNAHHKINEAILETARRKAKAMKVGLFSIDLALMISGSDERTTMDLFNKNSRTPYIYSDAGRGISHYGKMQISRAALIN